MSNCCKAGTSCFFLKKSLETVRMALNAEVAEWQTRYVQGVVSIRAWEFKSPLRHHSHLGACSSVG